VSQGKKIRGDARKPEGQVVYILDFLKRWSRSKRAQRGMDTFEYRLLCSGELYNSNVSTFDWRKSDATRILLRSPFTLVVCSQPFEDFPQEIALRFSAPLVSETEGISTLTLCPDTEISGDLAALLTLYCRRLITVAAKVRTTHRKEYKDEPALFQDWPIGFIKSLDPVHWERKPATVVRTNQGIKSITDYNPPPLGIDPNRLQRWLRSFPKLSTARSVLLSARLYSLALQQLEKDTAIAYQLLFTAVEATATAALREYAPTVKEKIQTKKSVADLALSFDLRQKQANRLAVEACKDMSWTKRKFVKFLVDNTTDDFWEKDDLFTVSPEILPRRDNYESVLKSVYEARGKLVHAGQPLPPSSAISGGPTISVKASMAIIASPSKVFPPVVWFERVVNHALNTFIDRSLASVTTNRAAP
jgi:hypothetical protein